MSFIIDKQTVRDLNLLGKYDSKSIYHVYDRTRTRGGRQLIEQMFHNPLTDSEAINARSALFQSFMDHPCDFPFDDEHLDAVEYYMSMPANSNRGMHLIKFVKMKSMLYIAGDRMIETMGENIIKTLNLFDHLSSFTSHHAEEVEAYRSVDEEVKSLLATKGLAGIMKYKDAGRLTFAQTMHAHRVLRISCHPQVSRLMEIIYHLDLQITVARVANEHGFTRAVAHPVREGQNIFRAVTLFHPTVQGAKGNDVTIDGERNMIFLTGANMAGKSTFMKSVGIAIYLAHMGFPVPAAEMEFTVRDGLFTSINVSDDIDLGHSHYYAEVMRVKHVAQYVAEGHNLFVILDELFKGTNVKDALDATSAVLKAFSVHRNCFFIVSTHILEAADALKDCPNIRYHYFPTELVGGLPRYTYRLTEGITADRHGMMIIRNERIVERIKGLAS